MVSAGGLAPVQLAHAQPTESASATSDAAPGIGATLSYTRDAAAARCPDEGELRGAVHAQLGYAVFERSPATRAVTVVLGHGRGGLRSRLEVHTDDGTLIGARELQSPSEDCRELASALALAISMALDPARLLAPKPDAASPALVQEACPPVKEPCPVCPAPAKPAPSTPPESAPAEDSSWRGLMVGVGAGLGLGALPEAAAALLVSLDVRLAHVAVHAGVAAYPGVSDGAIDTQLVLADLALCGLAAGAPQSTTFGLCGVGFAGGLRDARPGTSVDETTLTAAVGLRALAEVQLGGPVWLQGRAGLHANLVRTSVLLDGAEHWATPLVWGELGVLALMHFP